MALHFGPALFMKGISAVLEWSSLLPGLDRIVQWVSQPGFRSGPDSASRHSHSAAGAGTRPDRIESLAVQMQLMQERLGRLDAAVSGLSREVADLSAASRTRSAQLERMEALLAAAERRLWLSNIAMLAVAAASAAALVAAFVRK